MAKNITIAEGGVGRNFGPTKKLETDLQGGGTQYWIPEDEANDYASKEPLNVTENGTYTPSSGNVAFNPVKVNVPDKLGTKTITENGTYAAQDENLNGYKSVSVKVPIRLESKPITENGTYNAQDDNLQGYSSVRVNVENTAKLLIGTIGENGVLFPPTGYDGFSAVTVDVPLPGVTVDSGGNITIDNTIINTDGFMTVSTTQGDITVNTDGTITGGGT